MKKTLIIFAIVALLIAIFPIVGNKVIENSIDNQIELLKSYGVEVQTNLDKHGYLHTQKEYLLIVQDADKFAQYLNQFSDKNTQNYTADMLEGIKVGLDLEYSNFPLSDAVSLDIYLLSLPLKMQKFVESYDSDFEHYITKSLQNKTLLVHLDYSIAKSDFKGYVKNIDEKYTLKDTSILSFNLTDVSYSGNGVLGYMESLNLLLGQLSLNIIKDGEEFHLQLHNLLVFSTFESDTTYNYVFKLKKLNYIVKTKEFDDLSLQTHNIYVDFSSNTQGEKASFYSKSSFEHLFVETNSTTINLNGFNYDISLSEADKDSYEKLRILLLQADAAYTDDLGVEIQQSFIELFSKGVDLKIADFSLGSVATKNIQAIDGFGIKAEIVIDEDIAMAQDIVSFTTLISKNITIDSQVKFSKDLFSIINQEFPLTLFAAPYAIEHENKILFDLKFYDEKLRINDKIL